VSVTEGILEPFSVGLGYADWIDVATPAAGATASVTVEGGWFMRVLAARLAITTDANVANRLVTLDFINGRGVTYVQNGASLLVTASTTAQVFEWDIHRSVSEWNTGTPVWAPLQSVVMPPGFTVKFNVASVQATDQISGLHLWVEKFQTGPRGIPQGMVPAPGALLPVQ
jgi:hypothetical protein